MDSGTMGKFSLDVSSWCLAPSAFFDLFRTINIQLWHICWNCGITILYTSLSSSAISRTYLVSALVSLYLLILLEVRAVLEWSLQCYLRRLCRRPPHCLDMEPGTLAAKQCPIHLFSQGCKITSHYVVHRTVVDVPALGWARERKWLATVSTIVIVHNIMLILFVFVSWPIDAHSFGLIAS